MLIVPITGPKIKTRKIIQAPGRNGFLMVPVIPPALPVQLQPVAVAQVPALFHPVADRPAQALLQHPVPTVTSAQVM